MNNDMKASNTNNQFLISVYFFFLLVIIVCAYILSAFLYSNKPHRVEPQVLYYYNFSQSQKTFVPEVRNMTRTGNIREYWSRDNIGRTNVGDFIRELIVGPQNIYAEPFASKYTRLENVYYSGNNKEIYIRLRIRKEFEGEVSPEDKQKIQEWFEKNITNYFAIRNVYIMYH